MAGTAAKVICLIWLLSINGGCTQEQIPYDSNPDLSYNSQEITSGNDAIEMGRTTAEDMGALMASPPVNLIPLHRLHTEAAADRRQLFGQNNWLFPSFSQVRDSSSDMGDPKIVCFQYVHVPAMEEEQGRSAGLTVNPLTRRTVSPLTLPLLPMLPTTTPLGRLPLLPVVPPLALPIIQALFPPVPARRLRPLPMPRLPLIQPPSPIRPLRLPSLGRLIGKSSFTPNSFNRKYGPLMLYA